MHKRIINSKIADFMGWAECYDESGNFIDQYKFDSIVGLTYYIPEIGGYNPCDNFYQLKKVMNKMNSLGYRFQIHQKEDDNLWCCILWPDESHNDEVMAEATYSNEFGVAICLCILRVIKEEGVPKKLLIEKENLC